MMYIGIGFLAGILTAMGFGGGTILIPMLGAVEDISQLTLQFYNIAFFLPTAFFALYIHRKNNLIDYKTSKSVIKISIIGAIIGLAIALSVDTEILRKMFGVFLIVLGVINIKK